MVLFYLNRLLVLDFIMPKKQSNFCQVVSFTPHPQLNKLDNLKNALSTESSSETAHCSCSHVHNTHAATKEDESPHETTDYLMKIGQLGEYSAASMGLLVWGPWLEYLIPSEKNTLLNPIEALKLSPISLMISAPIVLWSMIGAGYCHLKLEELPRAQKLLLNEINNAITRGTNYACPEKQITIDGIEITLNPILFSVISPSEAPAFNMKDYFYLIGDVLAHLVEYVGLWLFVIALEIEDPTLRLILSLVATLVAAIACIPEGITCMNTLKDINAFKNYQIIDASQDTNEGYARVYHQLVLFSAFGKGIPAFLASGLNFQQIFLGNRIAGFLAGFFSTLDYTYCQYVINLNSSTAGSTHAQDIKTELEFNTLEEKLLASQFFEKDTLKKWKKSSLMDKNILIGSAFATGSERSEPYSLVLFLLLKLSREAQAGISASFLLLGVGSTLSFTRNALTHLYTYHEKSRNESRYAQITDWFKPCIKSVRNCLGALSEETENTSAELLSA